jgi:Calx-beta domain
MSPRKAAAVFALALASSAIVVVPAGAACAGNHLRVRLDGFQVPAGQQSFYWRTENESPARFRIKNVSDDCVGNLITVSWATSDVTATAGQDYTPTSGQTPPLNDEAHPDDAGPGTPTYRDVPVPIIDNADEPVVESARVSLSHPVGGQLADPSTAPIYIVDDEGANRVGLDGFPYAQSETYASVQIPVFRAGPASGVSTVSYEVAQGPDAPATPGEDFSPATGQVTFGHERRYELISFSIANDEVSEPPETIRITVTGADVPGGSSSTTFTILDNEENERPSSRIHHPRHKWRYKKSDYRIREVHVFTADTGGSGVVGAQFGLRRTKKNGSCQWLTTGGWQAKDCQNKTWVEMKHDPAADLFFLRLKQLKSSVDTRIKSYTAFSRAIDGAGNVERDFAQKRNDNTFEVKRTRRRP